MKYRGIIIEESLNGNRILNNIGYPNFWIIIKIRELDKMDNEQLNTEYEIKLTKGDL